MAAPVHPWIELDDAPVYLIRFPHSASDAEVRAFCAARERWAETSVHRCAWIADLSQLRVVSSIQRKIFADHLKRFEPHDEKYNQGSAIVVPNALVRGVVTAVFWISPPKFPNKAFSDVDSAREWAKEQFRNR